MHKKHTETENIFPFLMEKYIFISPCSRCVQGLIVSKFIVDIYYFNVRTIETMTRFTKFEDARVLLNGLHLLGIIASLQNSSLYDLIFDLFHNSTE